MPISRVTSEASLVGAYGFALVNGCDHYQQSLLAAATTLMHTQPRHPVLALLTQKCWEHAGGAMREQLRGAGLRPVLIETISDMKCMGKAARGGYFTSQYSTLAIFNLTEFRAILMLDTDISVVRNIDHVLDEMLRRPRLAQIRTPQSCRSLDIPVHAYGTRQPGGGMCQTRDGCRSRDLSAAEKWNGGVWGVSPRADVYREIRAFLRSGKYGCSVGLQNAATAFFGTEASQKHPGYFTRRGEEVMNLHVGYNLKPDGKGIGNCMKKHGLNRSSVHILHWSGTRKPWALTPNNHPLETRALWLYMNAYCRWSSVLNLTASMPRKGATLCDALAAGVDGLGKAMEGKPGLNFVLFTMLGAFLTHGPSDATLQMPQLPRWRPRKRITNSTRWRKRLRLAGPAT